ncbi:hypothetical protein IWW45_001545 [Coemansia sp. RSA 485]|nr:hypothetical protein IWW45_001545 [Coemansia sp. RSA 485]
MEVDDEYQTPNSIGTNNNNNNGDDSGVLSTKTEKSIIHRPDGSALAHTTTTTVRRNTIGQAELQTQPSTTTTTTTTAIVPTSMTAGQSVYPMLESLRTRPAMSFSPVGMAISLLDSDMSMVQGLIPDSQGICHYHRPVGILQNTYQRPIHDFKSINEIARRLRTRCLTSSSMANSTGDGVVKKGSVEVQKRAVQRALERISMTTGPRYSQRLDTLKSDHARRFQWHEQKVAEIKKREAERMARYQAERSMRDASAGFSIEEIDNDVDAVSPSLQKKSADKGKSKDKTMDSLDSEEKGKDNEEFDSDDNWLSDSEYDLEEAGDMLTMEALEMTDRMRRRAAKRRTAAGGVSKESSTTRGRRKGAQSHGALTSSSSRLSTTKAAAIIAAMGSADGKPSRGGIAGSKAVAAARGIRGGRGRLRATAAQKQAPHVLDDQASIRQLVSEMGNGDSDTILQILRSGVSADLSDSLGRTALHVASSSGNVEAIQLLVHMGADVNTTDRIGNTPLTLAATSARSDVILALLEGGADPRVGQGLVSAMTMVRARLRLLRMEIQQARMVERAATGSLSDLVPRVRERRHRAASVAKECVDIIHLLRHYIHKRIEEEEDLNTQRANILYTAYEVSQTEQTTTVPSLQAVSELDSLSAQLLSLGIAGRSSEQQSGEAVGGGKGKMPETQFGALAEEGTRGVADNPHKSEQSAADILAQTNEEDDQMETLLQQFSKLLGD